jgi:hypothetical protein
MTTELAQRRQGAAMRLLLIAGALVLVAAVTLGIEMRSSRPDLASGPVVPGFAETIGGAQRISVTSADASYRIERTQRGWAMRDRGDYPVVAARLAQLTEGLQQLQYVRRMTSDASKHERLGVTDPRQGGRGVLVQVEDGRGAFLVNLILGVETGGLYVRRPDSDQTWAARGELPPLRDIAAWLDLSPLAIDAERLARVEISPAEGPAYILGRLSPDAEFALIAPARQAFAASSVAAVAERITGLAPIDVQPAPAIQGAPLARVRVVMFDGVSIDGELIESDQRTWLKLVARAGAPEQEAAALEINNRAAAWAYALSSTDAASLAPPLSSVAPN